jgi:hypothetical protein
MKYLSTNVQMDALSCSINLTQLGLKESSAYKIVDLFGDQICRDVPSGAINLNQKRHSVRLIKFVDNSAPACFSLRLRSWSDRCRHRGEPRLLGLENTESH